MKEALKAFHFFVDFSNVACEPVIPKTRNPDEGVTSLLGNPLENHMHPRKLMAVL